MSYSHRVYSVIYFLFRISIYTEIHMRNEKRNKREREINQTYIKPHNILKSRKKKQKFTQFESNLDRVIPVHFIFHLPKFVIHVCKLDVHKTFIQL